MSIENMILVILALLAQSFAVTLVVFKQLNYYKKYQMFTFFIIVWFYCLISCFFIPNGLRFILFVTIIALAMFFVLNMKNKNVVLYSFNTEIIMSVSEILVSLLLVLFGLNSVDIVNNYYLNLLTNIFIAIVAIILIHLPLTNKLINLIISFFNKNKRFINYVYLFLIILYLIVLKNGFEFLLRSNYYINILFIIGTVIVLTIIIRNEFKYDQLNEQNKQMLNYVTKYEKIITEQGKANHEFKNQLMVIRGYAQMNSSRLIEYLDSIADDTKKAHSSYLISQLNKFPDGGIKGLLYYKLSIMDDENIKYDINVETGVKSKLKSLDTLMYKNITKILGVLLDNAIDASKKSKVKKIIISVSKENSEVIFSISNTYKGKVDLSKIGIGYTTKGNGHGYGLRLVKDIINENKMFDISNTLESEYFVSSLNIKTLNKKKK